LNKGLGRGAGGARAAVQRSGRPRPDANGATEGGERCSCRYRHRRVSADLLRRFDSRFTAFLGTGPAAGANALSRRGSESRYSHSASYRHGGLLRLELFVTVFVRSNANTLGVRRYHLLIPPVVENANTTHGTPVQ